MKWVRESLLRIIDVKFHDYDWALRCLSQELQEVKQDIRRIMSTEQELQTTLDTIKSGVEAVATKVAAQAATIAELQAQVGAGTPVTQEQLDSLQTEAQGIADILAPLVTPVAG